MGQKVPLTVRGYLLSNPLGRLFNVHCTSKIKLTHFLYQFLGSLQEAGYQHNSFSSNNWKVSENVNSLRGYKRENLWSRPSPLIHQIKVFLISFLWCFYYIIYTVLQCDLPPLRPHCGEAPGRDSNPNQSCVLYLTTFLSWVNFHPFFM